MRTYYLTILIILLAILQLESQEVFATQAWELSYEKQQDGWVDPGDRILITTEIFTYDSLVSNLIFTNPTSSPYLSLLPHTVETSHGTVTATDDANKVEVRTHIPEEYRGKSRYLF